MAAYQSIERGHTDFFLYIKPEQFIKLPFEACKSDDSIEYKVSRAVRAQFKVDPQLKDSFSEVTNHESIERIMTGSINLVNTIVADHKQKKPIDTLLFLDKSARNGAYIFRLLWNELKDRGELPSDIKMPNIRFINIGREDNQKYSVDGLTEILKTKYKKSDFENQHVLVVDESISSGKSMKRSLKLLEDVYNIIPSGIAQFDSLAPWYNFKYYGVLGITDFEDPFKNRYQIKKTLDNLSSDKIIGLYQVSIKMKKDKFLNTLSKIIPLLNIPKIDISSQFTDSEVEMEDINILYETFKGITLLPYDSQDVWEYLDSAGGFIARKLEDKHKTENSVFYRKVLKSIVSTYMSQRDVINKSSNNL